MSAALLPASAIWLRKLSFGAFLAWLLAEPEPLRYQITDGVLDRWVYSPAGYEKPAVETVFTAEDP